MTWEAQTTISMQKMETAADPTIMSVERKMPSSATTLGNAITPAPTMVFDRLKMDSSSEDLAAWGSERRSSPPRGEEGTGELGRGEDDDEAGGEDVDALARRASTVAFGV